MPPRSSCRSSSKADPHASASSTTAAPVEADATIDAGQRIFSVSPPPGASLAPGRYVVTVQLTGKGAAVPLQATADVTVPEPSALISQNGIALRRGPSTGLNFVATA